jgi:hypothetical protein
MLRGQPTSRAVTWFVVAVYTLVVSGIPLPLAEPSPESGSPAASRLADKDRSRPFPCMDKPCGCATAEQCFSSCCCNTPAELLAWAEARRLDPATLLILQKRVADAGSVAVDGSCCSAEPRESESSCCATVSASPPAAAVELCDAYRSLAAAPTCEATTTAKDGRTLPVDDQGHDGKPPRMISFQAMLACGGILAGWSAATTSLPPPPAIRCETAVSLVALVALVDDIALSADLLSDTPPPRA